MSPFDAVTWFFEFFSILAGVVLGGWLFVELLVWLSEINSVRLPRFFSGLSGGDWVFLAPVILVVLHGVAERWDSCRAK